MLTLLRLYYPLVLPGMLAAIILMTVVGMPVAAMIVSPTTRRQTTVTDACRSRLRGTYGAIVAVAGLVGTALGRAPGDRAGIVPMLTMQRAGYLTDGIMVLALLRPASSADVVPQSSSEPTATPG